MPPRTRRHAKEQELNDIEPVVSVNHGESLADELERVLRDDDEEDAETRALRAKWKKLDPQTASVRHEISQLSNEIRRKGRLSHSFGRSFWKVDCFIIVLLLVLLWFISKIVYDIDLIDAGKMWYRGEL